MVTSIDLIKEYCNLQHIGLTNLAGSDRFTAGSEILYLTENVDNQIIKMAKNDLKYCTKINRVVVIKTKTDMSISEKLIPVGTNLMIVHFEKNQPITNIKKKYLNEYFTFINTAFNMKMSTELIVENRMPQLIGKIKQTRNKIYWQELTTQLVPILDELKKYDINVTLSIDKLALRNNQYVWNWI